MNADLLGYLLPETLLVIAATAIYVAGAFVARRDVWHLAGLGALLLSGLALSRQVALPDAAPLLSDGMAQYVRTLALVVGGLFLLLSWRGDEEPQAPEQAGTLLLAVAGLMIVAGAGDLAMIFLGLELISIPSYVLLFLGRRDGPAHEAAAKYFFLSVLASAILLYGFSFLYGLGGSLELRRIAAALPPLSATNPSAAAHPTLARLALLLVFAGLGFKVAAAPFHFYAPDVYQGTSAANAGLLAVFPKIAGFIALIRIVGGAMPGLEEFGWRVALILAMLTMTVGNVLALRQGNLRRMLAYSSIAHSGYLLIGLAVALAAPIHGGGGRFDGVAAILVYLAVYAVATAGSFAVLEWLSSREGGAEQVDDLAGLGRTRPLAALALAVSLFSLAGVPPLAGFWGKLSLLAGALTVNSGNETIGAVQCWFLALAIVGILNAAIAAAYYLRLIGVMYFRPGSDAAPATGGGWGPWAAMLGAAVLTLALGAAPGSLVSSAQRAAAELREQRAQGVLAPLTTEASREWPGWDQLAKRAPAHPVQPDD